MHRLTISPGAIAPGTMPATAPRPGQGDDHPIGATIPSGGSACENSEIIHANAPLWCPLIFMILGIGIDLDIDVREPFDSGEPRLVLRRWARIFRYHDGQHAKVTRPKPP